MNRKAKGWLAEAAVKRHYEIDHKAVFNLSSTEPAADLLFSIDGLAITGVAEVKYNRGPADLDASEKLAINDRRQWCEALDYLYHLWHVVPTLGRGGVVVQMKGIQYIPLGIEPSTTRAGLRLKVYEAGKFPLSSPISPPPAVAEKAPRLEPSD